MALKKYTLNFDTDLIEKVDEYARSIHVNRTAALSVLLSTALEQKQAIDVIQQFLEMANRQTDGRTN